MSFQNILLINFHPILLFVSSLIFGIIIPANNNYLFSLLAIAFIGMVVLILSFYKKIFLIFIFFLGTVIGIISYKKQIIDYESFSQTFNEQSFDVIATIDDIQPLENSYSKQSLRLTISELYDHQKKKKIPINFTILVYCTTRHDFHIDDTIQLSNIYFKTKKNNSFTNYLLKEGIYFTFFLKTSPQLLYRPQCSLKRWFFDRKMLLLNRTKEKMSLACYTLFSSLFLGNKTLHKKYFDGIKEYFKYWGLSHYLARSGLHLIIFIILCSFLLRFLPCSFFLKKAILLLTCLIYYIFSWSSISFIRALITYCCYFFYSIFNYQINILHILCLVTLFVLTTNPLQLFFLDFQLSFILTFGLACIQQRKSLRA